MPPSALRRPVARRSIIGVLATALVLATAGCSLVKLGYGQASRLAYRWIDRYVDFDNEQSLKVRNALDDALAWHRRTQLPDYVQLLARAEAEVAGRRDARAHVRLGGRAAQPHRAGAAAPRADDRRRRAARSRRRRSRTSRSASPRPTRSTATITCSATRSAATRPRSSARSSAPRCCTASLDAAQRDLVAALGRHLAVRRRGRRTPSARSASRTCSRWCAACARRAAAATTPSPRCAPTWAASTARRARATAAIRSASSAHRCALASELHNSASAAQRREAAKKLAGYRADARELMGDAAS